MTSETGLRPVAMVAFGIALLCVLDALVKALTATHGTTMVVLLRYGGGALWAILFFLVWRGALPSAESVRANALRTVVVLGTAFTFYYALWRLPLAETIAITFTAPIFMAVLGRLILHETVGVNVVAALALGLAGVGVILGDRLSPGAFATGRLDGVLAALGSAICYALAMVLLRKQTARDPILNIVLLQNVLACAFTAPLAAVVWQTPSGGDLLLALGAGLFGTAGHLAMAWGYKRAEAARLGALEYTAFIWASLLGWAFFSETPTPTVFAGAVLIVAGAVIANRRVARARGLGPLKEEA